MQMIPSYIPLARLELDYIMTEIQEDLERVEQWMENNKLVLNLTNTKCMLFGTKQKLANFEISAT